MRPLYADWDEEYFLEELKRHDKFHSTGEGHFMLKKLEEACELLSYFKEYDKPKEFLESLGYKEE